jgi:hypothetical protein
MKKIGHHLTECSAASVLQGDYVDMVTATSQTDIAVGEEQHCVLTAPATLCHYSHRNTVSSQLL